MNISLSQAVVPPALLAKPPTPSFLQMSLALSVAAALLVAAKEYRLTKA